MSHNKLTAHFTSNEMACHCCGGLQTKQELMSKLENARCEVGIPFIIISGYRCSHNNKRAGGKANSSHLRGMAADIGVKTSQDRFIILKALFSAGFTRIGVARTFIHVDVDPCKTHNLIWTY